MNQKASALQRRAKYQKNRECILDHLGRACAHCKFDDPRALQIDHVNGNGAKERKGIGGGYYAKILKRILEGCAAEYQILCANCNAIKRYEKNEGNPRKWEGTYEPKPLKACGTHAAYHRGCRCSQCVNAHRTYCKTAMRASRARSSAELVTGIEPAASGLRNQFPSIGDSPAISQLKVVSYLGAGDRNRTGLVLLGKEVPHLEETPAYGVQN